LDGQPQCCLLTAGIPKAHKCGRSRGALPYPRSLLWQALLAILCVLSDCTFLRPLGEQRCVDYSKSSNLHRHWKCDGDSRARSLFLFSQFKVSMDVKGRGDVQTSSASLP